MQYGFVINQETCIGCHACTVACKAENDVPVGGFRTNVKYVESGKFPQVKRSFLVQRCNHCTNAPCVTICPVGALSKRQDGIVDIDRNACIGCRACMQACPYDALYLNEDLGAVEKCHFCAHRVEKGLQPACVTVCPVGAIVPGDMHDPQSEVSLLKAANAVSARRPEQATGPNVFYIGASEIALKPGRAERPNHYIWSQRRATRPEPWPAEAAPVADEREVLNSDAKVEWGMPVALYLLTKGVAGGAAMIAPFFGLLGEASGPGAGPWWLPESIALVFLAATIFLLIEDLAKPTHFYKLFTRPNWNSWLVKGGIVLTVFGGVSAVILLLGIFRESLPPQVGELSSTLRWFNAVMGGLVASYTAFLFKQCKGRDLWEDDNLLWHLLAQSVTAGAAAYLLLGVANSASVWAFAIGGIFLGVLHFVPHSKRSNTDNFHQAVGFLKHSKIAGLKVASASKWLIPILVLTAMLLMKLGGPSWTLIPVAALVLLILYCYEAAFVRAGQLPPLS